MARALAAVLTVRPVKREAPRRHRPVVLQAVLSLLGFMVLLAGAPNSAAAAEVRWNGPPDCAEHDVAIRQAEEILGRPLSTVSSIDFEVELVRAPDGSWRLRLETVEEEPGERRTRNLTGATCAEVALAAGVAIAMVIRGEEAAAPAPEDSDVPASDAPQLPEQGAAGAPAPPPDEPPTAQREPSTTPGVSWVPGLGVFAAADLGALPDVALGGELDISLRAGALRAIALGSLLASEERDDGDRGGEFTLISGALLGCFDEAMGRFSASACIGFEIGRLAGRGVGVANPRTGASLWAAPRAELGASFALSRAFGASLRAAATAPLVRREFVLDDTRHVHRPASITLRALAGVEVRFQ